ncbi:MAG: hypothetical protein IJQ61_00580 [Bacteroidales bacterium]|nr:hypothetical protein [Bacteroidales bacterium]MBR0256087.1 hypothetical protein [Bacteroidales bacterium]
MARSRKQYRLVPGQHPGYFHLPDGSATVYLNPVERTLYTLFLKHPEGILANALPLYRQDLRTLYSHESVYDNKRLMEDTMASLCDESHTVFYSTVSRIKKKFITALGTRKAAPYLIKRDKTGLYKTRATL